jgi:hypothetical protein
MSAGSSSDVSDAIHCSRNSGAPVSTTTGCWPRITIELRYTKVPGSAGSRLGIR